jgi:hypothetical protein
MRTPLPRRHEPVIGGAVGDGEIEIGAGEKLQVVVRIIRP